MFQKARFGGFAARKRQRLHCPSGDISIALSVYSRRPNKILDACVTGVWGNEIIGRTHMFPSRNVFVAPMTLGHKGGGE